MEIDEHLKGAIKRTIMWCEIDSGSFVSLGNLEERTDNYVSEFFWGGMFPRWVGYDERILKIINLN